MATKFSPTANEIALLIALRALIATAKPAEEADVDSDETESEDDTEQEEAPAKKTKAKGKAKPEPEEEEEDVDLGEDDAEEEAELSIDDVRAALKPLIRLGDEGTAAVKAILKKLGAKDLPGVDASDYASVIKQAKAKFKELS